MMIAETQEKIQEQDLPTVEFSAWLHRIRRALRTEEGFDVPCGECRACCTSSYFIHIRPDETRTRARIPKKLLFPAPCLPKGNVLLGYDENGRCPLFIANHCSIYADRPQTCRSYDCRIFPATGLPVGDDKTLITQQARRWQFDFPRSQDLQEFRVAHAAAAFLLKHIECVPAGFAPGNMTQQAVLALKVYEVFLNAAHESEHDGHTDRNQAIAAAIIAAYERFETAENTR